jgi:pyruvate dehydrogenase E2 component (dihydrolipoamide acetyltransferase)
VATPVEMPQLGNTVEECILTRWLRHEGDVVSAGDMIAEIETDKTTFEVTTPVDGTVIATFFDEGALVPVFTNIFVVGEPGESVDGFRPGSVRAAAMPAPAVEAAGVETEPVGRAAAGAAVSPRAARFAAAHGIETASIVGSGPGGRILEKDVQSHRQDSEGHKTQKNTEGRTPLTGLRGTIARRMRESLSTTAQYTLNRSADATGLLAARARLKTSATPDVTINDLVAYCTIQALLEVPALNAEFVDGRIVPHAGIHLGFAADTPKGLLAPVIRNAHTLTIAELAARTKDLTARAIDGTISPDDLTGATFTVSNLGSLGVESFTPVINTPQVAILGVGAIQTRPMRRNGQVTFVDVIGLSLTCDHQVVDGAPGAKFLRLLAEKIATLS